MKEKFSSSIGSYIMLFLEFKHAQGLRYLTGEYYLSKLDDYWTTNGFDSSFTKEHVHRWMLRREHESNNTHCCRMSFLREFSKFLHAQGLSDIYLIPRGMSKRGSKYMPYLFSDDKVKKFFSACDTMRPSKEIPCRALVLPAYFRFLYCCGVRTGEARVLRVEDTNLPQGYVDIIKAKGFKSRRLFIKDELLRILAEFDSKISLCYPNRTYFFPLDTADAYSPHQIARSFNEIWREAGLPLGGQPKPRAYDFRHHFAFSNINRWTEKGIDANGMLPYLMHYMGHSSIKSTFYYLHLVPEFFSTYSERTKSLENMIPEVVS